MRTLNHITIHNPTDYVARCEPGATVESAHVAALVAEAQDLRREAALALLCGRSTETAHVMADLMAFLALDWACREHRAATIARVDAAAREILEAQEVTRG